MTKGFDADIIFRSADRRHADKGMDGLLLWSPCQRIDFPGEGKPQVEIGRIFGVLAQMVERCVRIAEVRGSTPLGSTTSPQAAYRLRRLFLQKSPARLFRRVSFSEKGHAAPSLPACKRARDASTCYQPFSGLEGSDPFAPIFFTNSHALLACLVACTRQWYKCSQDKSLLRPTFCELRGSYPSFELVKVSVSCASHKKSVTIHGYGLFSFPGLWLRQPGAKVTLQMGRFPGLFGSGY